MIERSNRPSYPDLPLYRDALTCIKVGRRISKLGANMSNTIKKTAVQASRRKLLQGAAGLAAMGLPAISLAQNKPIKIGMPTILSGRVAMLGLSSRNAVMLEVEKFNAAGGLGGSPLSQLTSASPLSKLPVAGVDLLSQTPGLNVPSLNVSSIVGKSLPTDLTSNIRLDTSGLASLQSSALSVLGAAAAVSAAANIVKGTFSQQGLTGIIGGTLAASAISSAKNIFNQGSGIGQGASVLINPSSSIPAVPTANDIKQGLNINSSVLPSDSISRTISGVATGIPNALKTMGSDASNLINGVGNKLTALTSLPTDPQGIAAKMGLDPSKISGLGGALQSKLPTQVTDLLNKIPSNVNLTQAKSQGLVLDYIPIAKIANIPATPPFSKAPIAQPDPAYAKQVVERGGMTALQNLYGVNSAAKLSTNLVPGDLIASAEQYVSNSRLNPLRNLTEVTNLVDINAAKDKLGSFQNQLSGLTGQVKIPDLGSAGSAVTKFAAGTVGSSPLTNLVNGLNKNTGSS